MYRLQQKIQLYMAQIVWDSLFFLKNADEKIELKCHSKVIHAFKIRI